VAWARIERRDGDQNPIEGSMLHFQNMALQLARLVSSNEECIARVALALAGGHSMDEPPKLEGKYYVKNSRR